jgi:hypothetical protein
VGRRLISETGDWFLLVGLPIWVLQVTGSSLVTATVFLVGLLPAWSSARWPASWSTAGTAAAPWSRSAWPRPPACSRCWPWTAATSSGSSTWSWPSRRALAQLNDPARNALVPHLVAADDLVGANALIGLNSNLARLAGSPLGGILVELSGLPGLVIGDAVSFLPGAA